MGKHKRKREVYSTCDNNNRKLSVLLNHGLLTLPTLCDELPAIIAALDNNESVNVKAIQRSDLRDYLNSLMQFLPVDCELQSYAKKIDCISVSGHILMTLLKEDSIVQPANLLKHQSQSSRAASKFIEFSFHYPKLLGELEIILENIRNGQSVQLENMEDHDLVLALESLFAAIGVVLDQKIGYGLPSKHSMSVSRDDSKSMLDSYLQSLRLSKSYQQQQSQSSSSLQGVNSVGVSASSSSDDDSDHNKDGGDLSKDSEWDNSDDDNDIGNNIGNGNNSHRRHPQPAVKGPCRPSTAQLLSGQQLNTHRQTHRGEEEDEEEVGPAPLPREVMHDILENTRLTNSCLPLGMSAEDKLALHHSQTQTQVCAGDADGGPVQREEWITCPGALNLFGAIKEGTNRKFQSGRQSNKIAVAFHENKEAVLKEQQQSETYKETQAILQEYNASRGPSLLEQHQQTSKFKVNNDVDLRLVPFNRERDMLSHSKLDKDKVKQIVEQSKELNNRFSSGTYQTSF